MLRFSKISGKMFFPVEHFALHQHALCVLQGGCPSHQNAVWQGSNQSNTFIFVHVVLAARRRHLSLLSLITFLCCSVV
jgi:hypothetical protein